MKRITLSLIALLLCLCIQAQHRSEQEAIQIAQEFFAKKQMNKAPRLSVVPQQKVSQQIQRRVASAKKTPAQNSSFYIINDEESNRFVIVAADERLNTILGYSDHGAFDDNKAPEGLLELMLNYDAQYSFLLANGCVTSYDHKTDSKDIGPLIPSQWGQDSPFNDDCPENKKFATGELCASGCVATAMAQVMNYYKYPAKGQGGTYTYTINSQGIPQSFNYDALTINWDNILNIYDSNSTDKQKSEVAKLLHACGVSVSMDYGEDNYNQSGAYSPNIPYAMIHYFGYNPNVVYYDRAYFSDKEWNQIIMAELESSRQILYSGQSWLGGHQFILDGCNSEGKYHFNFGWKGDGDGYFEIDAISPSILQNYSSNHTMVCLITPNEVGIHEDVFYSDIFTINNADKSETKVGRSVDFEFSPICYSSNSTYKENRLSTFSGKLGVGLYDTNFNYLQSLKEYNVSDVAICEGFNVPGSLFLYSGTFKDGEYYIAPYAKASESKYPTRIRTPRGERDFYYVSVDNGNVQFQVGGGPTPPSFPVVVEGDYNISASNIAVTKEKWNISIWQDREDAAKYWISNFDPAVAKKGYNYESGWNKVYGYINETHTQLSVPVNQEIGKDIVTRNISGGNNITIQLTEKDGKMYFSSINDIWGSKELSAESEMSRYQYTTIAYGKIDGISPIETPSIDVSSNSFTLHCGTKGAVIYYTTDNSTPSENNSRYNNTPVSLYHNCTIKAIACKDGQSSEVATYKVTTFKVKTPIINRDESNLNHYTFTCATEGASIYYDWDGKTRQTGSLDIKKSGVIKVYAEKDDFIKSDVKEQSLEYIPDPVPAPGILVIADNEAGKLSTRISDTDKLSATRLTVSGKINGTDIIFIREMFYHGKLTDLDMENATIVSGGDAYDTTINAVTEDNNVGMYFFENCKQMVSIKLPSSAVKIERHAFSGCKSLKKLDIPISCVEVESMALINCDNLEEVNFSDAVQNFPGLAVYLCKNLMKINVSEGNQYYKSVDGVLFSKDGKILVRYPMGKSDISYTIPNGVVTIGKEAFDNAKIASVTIPNTVTTIESSAFESCKDIQSLIIPNSVTTIGESAFSGCNQLDNVTMSSEVSHIKSFTFGNCENLRKFYIGAKVSSIDKLAFYNCQSLQEFEVDENSNFFTAQTGILYTKDMQELVKCPMAMYSAEYIVPNGVKVIRAEAFATCTNIKRFYLPETLTTIGECAFENCEMASIRIPQTVTEIGEFAFNNCNNLESLVLPEGIKKIQNMTLHGCKSLSYVYIPANVEEFGMWAIADCPSLTMINCQIKDIENIIIHYDSDGKYYDSFEGIPVDCTWRVPADGANGTSDYDKYVELYKAQPWWVPTWRIILDDTSVIEDIAATNYGLLWNEGKLNIQSSSNGVIRIYAIDGTLIQNINAKSGEQYQIDLPRGIYIINNKKIVIK
ncbi:MAG: leucine-rich repeat protein [Prevotella sp.]|nr:leucine-rich repeat protein [Prevotella sp.]